MNHTKLNCMISDNPRYQFWISITYYNRINGASNQNITHIHINLTNNTSTDIGSKILTYLNAYLASKGKDHRF
jgi:hypothetical protein